MEIKAIVYEDIPANRLIGLKGAALDGDLDSDKIYVKLAGRDWNPDMVSSRELKEGEEVTVKILGNPIWEAELSKDTRPGTLVSADHDGKICGSNTRDFNEYIGYSIEGGKAGDSIKYVRKTGLLVDMSETEMAGLITNDEG